MKRRMRVARALGGLVPALFFLGAAAAQQAHPPKSDGSDRLPPASALGGKKQTFDLRIEHRKVAGALKVVRVSQGEMVRLRWRTDEATTIHLHGYDIEKAVKPDAPAVMTFKAHATGRFPITAHGFGGHSHGEKHAHGKKEDGETILLYLEVHPR